MKISKITNIYRKYLGGKSNAKALGFSGTNNSDDAANVFGLKFVNNKARLQSSKHKVTKLILTQNDHSRSRVLESVERQ